VPLLRAKEETLWLATTAVSTLNAGVVMRADIKLQVGSAGETIDVINTVAVNTENARISHTGSSD